MGKRLPKNNKEGLIYGLTISIVTVTLMVLLNIGTEKEITKEIKQEQTTTTITQDKIG